MRVSRPHVAVRRVHAEPDAPAKLERGVAADGDVAWLALWDDGAVTRHVSARALVRTVRRRDRRDAERAAPILIATVITWNDVPAGFVPPTTEDAQ